MDRNASTTSHPSRRAHRLAWIVLLTGLAVSLVAWWVLYRDAYRRAEARFLRLQERALLALDDRLAPLEQALYAGRVLVPEEGPLEHETWRRFTDAVLPFLDRGIIGLGYVERVPRSGLTQLEARMAAAGYRDFVAQTKGPLDPVYIVTHVEPLARNRPALGKDVGSGVTRRPAAEDAMRTGKPVITRSLQVFEARDTVAGSLLFVPVYTGPEPTDPDARARALKGWVYASMKTDSVLSGAAAVTEGQLDLTVRDSAASPADPPIYASHDGGRPRVPAAFENAVTLPVYGRWWRVSMATNAAFDRRTTWVLPWLVLCGGSVMSLMAAGFVFLLAESRSRALALARDMTAHLARTEAEARKLALVASHTASAVIITDADWRIEWANDSFLRYFGYTFDEIKGRRPGEFLHGPDSSAATRQAIDTACARGEPFRGEILNYTKTGERLWVALEIQPIKDPDGKVSGYMALQLDITERKRIQESLARKEAEFRFIFESAPIGLSWRWVGPDGSQRRLTNAAHDAILGLTHEQQADRDVFRRLSDPREWSAQQCLYEQLERGEIDRFSVEKRYRRLDGSEIWAELTIYRIRNPAGGYQEISTLVDLTQLKEQARQLEAAKDAAEAANRAKSQFLAMMSHEIRTPMNGVIGMTSLLLDSPLTATQRDYVETIRYSGDALLTIINGILDFSKIESGRLELEHAEFALRSVVEAALDLFAPTAARKKLSMRLDVAEGVPSTIRSDATRLRQILVNLVGNAVKFTDAGEIAVGVHVAGRTSGKVELLFAVRDTGIGIASGAFDRLFRPFSQVDPSTARRYGGTGLGLAISRRLAELMGGRMWVESEPGLGSTFSFTVQVEAVEGGARLVGAGETSGGTGEHSSPRGGRDAPPPTGGGEAPAGRRERVLVAEDNAVNQKVAASMLRRLGFRADFAGDGHEVIEAVGRQPYDIILMDVQMPDMDGLQAARAIRAGEKKSAVRPWIIAVTANALPNDREACIAAGMDDYISKPVRFDELAAALEQACTALRARRS